MSEICRRERRLLKPERPHTRAEELANSVSHGVGVIAASVGAPVLLLDAIRRGTPATILGASVFSATMLLLYTASTIYHALPTGRVKEILRVVDHAAIFLLIAGTYTPFTLGVLRGPWGWTLFFAIWLLACGGVVLKILHGTRYPVVSTWLYVGMGWLMMTAIRPLCERMPAPGIWLLIVGGLCYTGGLGFYAARKMPFRHFIWHLFVLAGTACHFFAVLHYAG
jgi:hemolysin III